MSGKITLFISRTGAHAAIDTFRQSIRPMPDPERFRVSPATLTDILTGEVDHGFKVSILNAAGHPVGHL